MFGGGLRNAVLDYYKYIDRTKIQYDFFLASWEAKSNETLITSLGGRVFSVPLMSGKCPSPNALYQYFVQNKYPVVYSHINTLSVFPLFAAWRAGVPVSAALSQSTAGKGELKRNIMKYTLRMFSRAFATHYCACSRLAGEFQFGKHAMNSGRVVIWPNAIDTERFAYNEAIHQAMDVFILPSLYEGLPVVGSEVQVSGLPFLCADTVTPETKFCDNLHFLSLNKNPDEWAQEALSLSLGHIRHDMSQYARNSGFDIHQQAQNLSHWYCQLLGI